MGEYERQKRYKRIFTGEKYKQKLVFKQHKKGVKRYSPIQEAKRDEIINVKFMDKKKFLWNIEVYRTWRNGYMEFAMSGKGDYSLGQNIDRVNPANKHQKALVDMWKTYHLKEIDNKIWKKVLKIIDQINKEEDKRRKDETVTWDDIKDPKIVALGQHLEMTPEEAQDSIKHERGNYYDAGGNEFLVCNDKEADEEAQDYMKSSIEELGPQHINGWENYIDEGHLARELKMDSGSEYDVGYDDPGSFIDEEPEEDGDWSDDQRERAGDKAEEDFKDRIDDDPAGYLEDIYGDSWVENFPNIENYIDEDGLIDYVIRSDGRGHLLNRYDGEEHEEKVKNKWYFIYEQ